MSGKPPLYVLFLWHMHQPSYQDPVTGAMTLPWVRLHAAKDYVDMVALLEEFPAIRQTFNLTPVLLEQLAWYVQGGQDAWEILAGRPAEALAPAEAARLARQCTFAHPQRMVAPSPRHYELVARVQRNQPLTAQDLRDLTVWFHLVWVDPRWREEDPVLAGLVAKGQGFTEEEKAAVLAKHRALMAQVVPAYRAARERGQVELTTSPYAHPIIPLLVDTHVAVEATPRLPGPAVRLAAPEDAAEQLRRGRQLAAEVFGAPPRGLWPSEGAVSQAILPAVAAAGFEWLATDEAILWKSLSQPAARQALYQPYEVAAGDRRLAVLFRDRGLSDLIGFTYAGQPAAQAADDFLRRLRAIHQEASAPAPCVAVILDGENAWEHYPHDGQDFLRHLYNGLSRDPAIRCVTVSDYLTAHPPRQALARLAPGSWIRGDFTTWIGDPEKNRAWELLAQARAAYAQAEAAPGRTAAQRHLLVAEGSDWFWWYGPEHTSAHDAEFDRLFRERIAQVYTALEAPVPPAVREPIARAAAGGQAPPTRWMTPRIDGLVTDYFEWLAAGRVECAVARGTMAPGQDRLQRVWWGCDATHWYLRFDLATWPVEESLEIRLITDPPGCVVEVVIGAGQVAAWVTGRSDAVRRPIASVAAERIIEVGIPMAAAGVRHGVPVVGRVEVRQGGAVVEMVPASGSLTLQIPEESDANAHWSA